jgi:hypothetical protein
MMEDHMEDVILQKVILLKASHYKMEDGNEGVTTTFYPFKDLKTRHTEDRRGKTEGTYGYDATNGSFPMRYWELVKSHGVPAVYQFTKEFGMDYKTRKETMRVTDVKFVGYLSPELLQSPPATKGQKQ